MATDLGYNVGLVMGGILGVLIGMIVAIFYTNGRAFFIRFFLGQTPIEAIIIGIGKISVPVKAIVDGQFEHNGFPYVVPEGRTMPKSLLTGSVSAIYFEGIPFPVLITTRTLNFRLKDNTILSDTFKTIFHNDSLKKMMSRERIQHIHLALLMILAIGGIAMVLQYTIKETNYLQGLSGVIEGQLSSFRTSMDSRLSQVIDTTKSAAESAGKANPNAPQPPPTPPGG